MTRYEQNEYINCPKIWTGIKIQKTRPVIDDKNALILLSNVK